MIDTCDLERLLVQELERDVLVEFLDIALPVLSVERFRHRFPLLGVQRLVSRAVSTSEVVEQCRNYDLQHEVGTALAHQFFQGGSPCNFKVFLLFEDCLCANVRGDVHARLDESWSIP